MSSGKERFNHVFRRACLIGQIKKNQNSRAFAVSPRGTGQTSSKASLYDVERSGSGTIPKDGCSQTCSLTCDVMCVGLTRKWWSRTESNRRHPACKAGALPTELRPQSRKAASTKVQPQEVVGLGRFELPTSRLSSARSNQLSYRPVNAVCVHEEERETKTAAPRE